MNANASTKKLEMKIGFHRLNPLHSKPLFIVVERFDMDNFLVPVWHLRRKTRHRKLHRTPAALNDVHTRNDNESPTYGRCFKVN